MSITLIGSPVSPFVRKVNVVLLEKGLDFDLDPVNPFSPPEGFREISPLGRIPALRHDDRIVVDSSVIVRYLDRLAPEPPLYPSEPYAAARAEWIEEFADGGLVPVAGPGVFARLVLRPLLMGAEPDEEGARKVIEEDLPPLFDYLDGELGEREFFVDDRLTIADIGVACPMVNLRLAGVKPDRERWPALHDHVKRMHARHSMQGLIAPLVGSIGKRWVELD